MSNAKREFLRFLVAGCMAVGTDMGTYYLFLNWLDHSAAKAVSFMLGTAVAYLVNKYWTFEQHRRSFLEALKFVALYLFTLGANVGMNKGCLIVSQDNVLLSFLVATGTSATLNFAGQKWWVFRKSG